MTRTTTTQMNISNDVVPHIEQNQNQEGRGVEGGEEGDNANKIVNIESSETDNNSSTLFAGRGVRGRFRGREAYRGRGRFAGRIIRGRNKTWVRGPGTETPLTTDR